MRHTKNTVTRPQAQKPFLANSGADWSIWRDPATRDYAVYVAGQYVGSRRTLSEAPALRRVG